MGVSGQRHAPAALYPGERTPATNWTGGWVDPGAGLDAATRRKILCPCRGSKPGRSVRGQSLYWLSYLGFSNSKRAENFLAIRMTTFFRKAKCIMGLVKMYAILELKDALSVCLARKWRLLTFVWLLISTCIQDVIKYHYKSEPEAVDIGGGWVGPRAGLDAGARRKILCLCRGSNCNRPARSQTLFCLSYRNSC
jgi:hypothetical protein